MESYCSEGIILNVIPFQNYEQIMTVFTPQHGIIKLFCKKGKKNWQRFTPLTKIEIVFRLRNSELFACEEISLLDNFLNLRKDFSFLQAGCDLIQSILQSQMLGKGAPLLYQLLNYYLDRIAQTKNLDALMFSFKLKILKHEGVLHFEEQSMKKEEMELLNTLAFSQNFSQICQAELTDGIKRKINLIFNNLNFGL